MSETVGRADDAAPEVATRLREAHRAREDARAAVEEVGRDRLTALRDAVDTARRLFDRYEEAATGTGDFQSYLAFQEDVVEFVEDLPEDLPERDTFEAWLDTFKKRQLSTRDFDQARADLEDADALVERLEDLADAAAEFRQAVADAKARRDDLQDRITHLERVRELGAADLDAPVEDLRDPIEAYNEGVQAAFDEFLHDAPARDVLAHLDHAAGFPLVDIDAPPADLHQYVETRDVGEESVHRLLELADFSRSKLQHYVDDPGACKRIVAGNRTYLDSLSASPFFLDWPPAPAAVLRRRVDEHVSVVGRFADEDVVAALRTIQQRTREDRYDDLRDAAIARAELSADDRDRIQSGDVEADIEAAREALARIEETLDEYSD